MKIIFKSNLQEVIAKSRKYNEDAAENLTIYAEKNEGWTNDSAACIVRLKEEEDGSNADRKL